jgi:CxxC motif-containing protein (DUF1111 family)
MTVLLLTMIFIYTNKSLMLRAALLFSVVAGGALAACSSPESPEDPLKGLTIVGDDLTDVPLKGASSAETERFNLGDARFDAVFRGPDGLGPLYIRDACSSCHEGAARGPGAVQKMVIVEDDGITPAPDQSSLPYGHTERPYYEGGGTTPIAAPADDPSVLVTRRLGPPVFGRGYMEAVDDAEIERVEAEQAARSDGIHGRINRVIFHSKANPEQSYHAYQQGDDGLIGRFGFKARVATLDDFAADAFQGDMGLTSPMRPDELPNPDGLADDAKSGVDVDLDTVNVIADYMRLLEIPRRVIPEGRGEEIFAQAKCAVCHVPSLKTRKDYPIAILAGIDAPVYTDLLLHDLGDALADGLTDEEAGPRAWKTAPLIGLRHFGAYLHDGRAPTLELAILAHGGEGSEAASSVELFKALSASDRDALLTFLEAL